jgi:hypothetical protein
MSRFDNYLVFFGRSSDKVTILPDAILENHALEISPADHAIHDIAVSQL